MSSKHMLSSIGRWNARLIMQVQTEVVVCVCGGRCHRYDYKPWLEESTLSSQSEADSTGRGEDKSISTVTEWYEKNPEVQLGL